MFNHNDREEDAAIQNLHEEASSAEIKALRARLAEVEAERDGLREAMKGPLAWLERWAVHVGSCETNPECTCGLMLAQHELRAALGAKI